MPSNNRPTPLDLVPNFDADSGPVEVPHPPSELVHLDETAVRVLDADDEVSFVQLSQVEWSLTIRLAMADL